MRARARTTSFTAVAALATALAPACTQGEGTGAARGTLDVQDCWSGPFDLHPDFFAAVPAASGAMQIRVQNGGDYESFSDGMAFLIDDAGEIRGDPGPDGAMRPVFLNTPLVVGLPAGVTPPGVPLEAVAHPSIVHASLYLEKSCRTQNVALFALPSVTLNADGSCERPEAGEPVSPCGAPATLSDGGGDAATPADAADAISPGGDAASDGSVEASAGAPMISPDAAATAIATGTSTITFSALFDDNPNEPSAQQRLTDATFDLYFGDPREICPGGLGPPPRCRGHLQGYFRFYFQRGQPAQPFP